LITALPHPELIDQDAELRVPLVVRDALRPLTLDEACDLAIGHDVATAA
jgi:hypothetical protein